MVSHQIIIIQEKKKQKERRKSKMRNLVKLFSFLFLLSFSSLQSQALNEEELSYSEFLGYVKKYHPLVKQANLELTNAQAKLMAARGGFDPKIEVDYNKKEFKGTEYYSLL